MKTPGNTVFISGGSAGISLAIAKKLVNIIVNNARTVFGYPLSEQRNAHLPSQSKNT